MKHHKTALLTILLTARSASLAQARLGDTVAQSNKRYRSQGTRFETTAYGGPASMIWTVGDWNIEEWFNDGVCTIIQYSRTDKGWLREEELVTLLNNNRVSGQWSKLQREDVNEWVNGADALYAKYFFCPMVSVNGIGRGFTTPVMRFATERALSMRGLLRDDRSNDQPADNNNGPTTLQSI